MDDKERVDYIASLPVELRVLVLECQIGMLKQILTDLHPELHLDTVFTKAESAVIGYFKENLKPQNPV